MTFSPFVLEDVGVKAVVGVEAGQEAQTEGAKGKAQ